MQKLIFVIRFSFLKKDGFDKSNPYLTPTLILPPQGGGDLLFSELTQLAN
jgi:hypothetical protein